MFQAKTERIKKLSQKYPNRILELKILFVGKEKFYQNKHK